MKKTTQMVIELGEKLSTKYAETVPKSGSQTYHIWEEINDNIHGKWIGDINDAPNNYNEVANKAALQFFNQPSAQRVAGTKSGLFSVNEGKTLFYME